MAGPDWAFMAIKVLFPKMPSYSGRNFIWGGVGETQKSREDNSKTNYEFGKKSMIFNVFESNLQSS